MIAVGASLVTTQKRWDTVRAQAAIRGLALLKSDPQDGPVRLIALRGQQAFVLNSLDDLEALWVGAARAQAT